ncbi:hypothetical protein [Pilimelia anulata]|uniref:hypothetical protein n=1 Tax=Pilimelia anulata TaxID=53371 RepID=UPI001664CFB6|nr:hypothetical protein [Pilimelia anulata]
MTFKRRSCLHSAGRRLEECRPQPLERSHGSWHFQYTATNLLGRREQIEYILDSDLFVNVAELLPFAEESGR